MARSLMELYCGGCVVGFYGYKIYVDDFKSLENV